MTLTADLIPKFVALGMSEQKVSHQRNLISETN